MKESEAQTVLYAPPESAPKRRTGKSKEALLAALVRENEALRRELAKLEGYRTLAYRDGMTGLWNRRFFDERLAEEMCRASRDPQRRFSIMVADVNGLKAINDSLGHAAGDRLITAAGRFLRQTLRTYDLCCRTGGDEFAVIFPDLGEAECDVLVTRMRKQLDKLNATRGLSLSLSFGCASYPTQGQNLATLLALADTAMYSDKRKQKGRGDAVVRAAG